MPSGGLESTIACGVLVRVSAVFHVHYVIKNIKLYSSKLISGLSKTNIFLALDHDQIVAESSRGYKSHNANSTHNVCEKIISDLQSS